MVQPIIGGKHWIAMNGEMRFGRWHGPFGNLARHQQKSASYR